MLSPETIRQMIQTYEAWVQSPLTSSRPLETMKWAYQQICAGKDPWTGLGSFCHAWYGYAKDNRLALVTEPLTKPEQETEYTQHWGAFCSASVEWFCSTYGVPCPIWVHDPAYNLLEPWFTRQSKKVRYRLIENTPVPFSKRNIFCGNRMFLNKYEGIALLRDR